jgi:DNA ligase (NAD+)
MNSENRIQELSELILQARQAYYNGMPSAVTDETYDAWVDELAELQADHPAVTAIGAPVPVSGWPKVSHEIPMGSLDKVNALEELTGWVTSVVSGGDARRAMTLPLMVTEKLDGISIAVAYVKGAFSQAVTRGDGIIGEDISQNVAKMVGVPGRLPEAFTGSLRGEIILTKSELKNHFQGYKNTRNAASGIAKRYDGQGCEYLSVLFYRVADGKDFLTEADQFEWITSLGLLTPQWYLTAMTPGVKTPQDLWVEYQASKRDQLDYDIDGLVVAVDDLELQLSLGEKDGRPKGAVAFKFAPITRETTLKRIDWQVGGAGRITPVAVFDPVPLMGATVTNASLYNVKYIEQLQLDIGAKILVARANDVIPRVVSARMLTGTVAQAPQECPACGSAVIRDGEYVLCPNVAECPAQLVGRLKRYVSELGIKEWGEGLLEKLVESKLVKDVSDLYILKSEDLAGIDRMAEKSAQNVLQTLWAKNPIPLENLLGALSIPLCGSSTIRAAMDAGLDTWPKILASNEADFEAVPGVGPVRAHALDTWLSGVGSGIMGRLFSHGVEILKPIEGVLTGQSFCFTGAMQTKRPILEQLVKDHGGAVKSSVTKGLTCLVIADPNSTSSKAKVARKNGTQCISEKAFLQMVGL